MPADRRVAHIDESGAAVDGGRVYALAAVVTPADADQHIDQALRGFLPPGRTYLHHYDDTLERRLETAHLMAGLPLIGALIEAEPCARTDQEGARHRLLCRLLRQLQDAEQVGRAVIESRGGSDRADIRTINRLRRSRAVTSDLRVDHRRKSEASLLWVADFVASSWVSHRFHGEDGPWKILNEAHVIEVR